MLAFDHPPVLASPYKEVAFRSGSCLPSPCLGVWLVLYTLWMAVARSSLAWALEAPIGNSITVASLTFFSYSLSSPFSTLILFVFSSSSFSYLFRVDIHLMYSYCYRFIFFFLVKLWFGFIGNRSICHRNRWWENKFWTGQQTSPISAQLFSTIVWRVVLSLVSKMALENRNSLDEEAGKTKFGARVILPALHWGESVRVR